MLRAAGIVVVILLNLFMWKSFNRALQTSSTSLVASLVTTAANLLFTVGNKKEGLADRARTFL